MAFLQTSSKPFKARVVVALIAGLIAVAPGANATPVDLFFNGTVAASDGIFYGLSDKAVVDFLAAGGQRIGADGLFADPNRDFVSVVTPHTGGITPNDPGGPDFIANPAKATNDWVIDPLVGFDHLWIVFRGHSPNDPNGGPGGYLPQNVGLNIDPMGSDIWRLITIPAAGQEPEANYLALYLGGNIGAGDDNITQTIDYRVTQPFETDPSDPDARDLVPQYLIGYMQTPFVPEPGVVALLGVGLLGLASRRARR